jgi:alpha-L-rhamnosidase
MNSFNHYAYGAIGQWMYERIAGLEPDPAQPGYKHFFIRPQPGGPLTSACAELKTTYGTALSAWKIDNGILKLEAVVPPNTTATLKLPGKTATILPPGRHLLRHKRPARE